MTSDGRIMRMHGATRGIALKSIGEAMMSPGREVIVEDHDCKTNIMMRRILRDVVNRRIHTLWLIDVRAKLRGKDVVVVSKFAGRELEGYYA